MAKSELVMDVSESLSDVIIGVVSSKSVSPARGDFGETTWVRLAGGAVAMMVSGNKISQLPKDDTLAVFRVAQSRSGKSLRLAAWGWLNSIVGPYSASPQVNIYWAVEFDTGPRSLGGGMVPPDGSGLSPNGH